MEPVQYKGYRIEVKHYPAFRHSRREYSEVFDYVIFGETGGNCKGYGFNSAEEARIAAKSWIDAFGPMEIT